MNRKFLFILSLIFSLFLPLCFGQESINEEIQLSIPDNSEEIENETVSEPFEQELSEQTEIPSESEKKQKKSFWQRGNLSVELTPGFYFNPSTQNLVGETSSSIFPFSFGFLWPNDFWIAVEPSISFYTMYHLWYDGTTYPAEPENRTSQTFNFMINLPVSISLTIKNSELQLTPGFGFLARFGVLANGVSATDFGYSGSAEKDVAEINNWFWKNGRFLYLSLGVSYLIKLTEKLRGGPAVHAFVPVGTIFSGESIQGMTVTFGMKVMF